jgi:predicted Zn-dependent protease
MHSEMRTQSEIKELLYKILKLVQAPQAKLNYYARHQLAIRFGDSVITQSTGGQEEAIQLTVAYQNKSGSSSTNRLEPDALQQLVRRAENIARNSLPDPEYRPPISLPKYPAVPARFYDDVVNIDSYALARDVKQALEAGLKHKLTASGLFKTSYGQHALANSEGLFAFDRYSHLDYSLTMHGKDGSGFARENRETRRQLPVTPLIQTAVDTALQAQNPRDVEPGKYTVIFEPLAVFDFLSFLFNNMSQRACDEGTSAFTGLVGKRLFSEKVNISTKLNDSELPPIPFGQDGLPAHPRIWIERGIVKRLYHDRFWASQKNSEPDALLRPLFMEGEEQSISDMVAHCQRGLLVKRLWYLRYVDRKELLLTGMTRDGLFWIENGQIRYPVKNLRFNETPLVFLRNIVELSRAQRVGSWAKMPGIMSRYFSFSSKTEAV